jgi:hypothetical protein
MSYFNKSFQMLFLGTQQSGAGAGQNPNPNLTDGFVTQAGITTDKLTKTSATAGSNYGPGSFGFFDHKNGYVSVDAPDGCCPLILAAAAPYSEDKIGQQHGGYLETNKSKIINPRFITKFYRVDPCEPQNQVINVGRTPYTNGLSPAADGCCKEFLCGETYHLRIDVKGAPALRFLNRQAYLTIPAYTGCCADPAVPAAANSTNVMIAWAQAIVDSPILKDLVMPVVYGEDGNIYYPPGTDGAALTWDIYDQDTAHTANACAGLILYGAYVDTKFGNCSFQPSDYYNTEPVQISVSEVDLNGNPCEFTGLCVVEECCGNPGNGNGETLLRNLILSERYLQNDFDADQRMREIKMTDELFSAIDRNTRYYTYFIEHVVPRTQNPSASGNNDRYLLAIVTTGVNAALEAFMATWLATCPITDCVGLETYTCTECTPLVPQDPSA